MVFFSLSLCRFLPNDFARGAPPPGWFEVFLQRILEHNPHVLALLGAVPELFRQKPPSYVRALIYDYRYTYKRDMDNQKLVENTPTDQIGKTWYRNFISVYVEPISKQE